MQASEAAHERFVAESKEMDAAWANGTLDQWLAKKIDAEKRGLDGNDGSDAGGAAAVVA